MAIKSTVFKIKLAVADLRRNYYADHALILARHPSETDSRMLLRLAVFALNAHERLQFTKGLSSAEEPDLWQIDLTGTIEHWLELGQPTEKRLRQACGKAAKVSVYTYQKHASKLWFESQKETMERFRHLHVVHLGLEGEAEVAALIERSMALNCTIDEDQVMLSSDAGSLAITTTVLKAGQDGKAWH